MPTTTPRKRAAAKPQVTKTEAEFGLERLTDVIDYDGATIAVYRVNPEAAERLLGLNTHNRSRHDNRVARYQEEMNSGDWVFTGDPIQIDTNRVLSNGQHRLTAQIKCGATLDWVIVQGLKPAAQTYVDKNRVRSYGDTLRLFGVGRATEVASLVSRVQRWDDDGLGTLRSGTSPGETRLEQVRAAIGDEETQVAVSLAQKTASAATPSRGILAAMWVILGRIEDAEEDRAFFYDRLHDGAGLVPGDALYAMRKRFSALNTSITNGRVPESQSVGLMIKAWNAYRTGQTVTNLSFRQGGARPEPMPTPL